MNKRIEPQSVTLGGQTYAVTGAMVVGMEKLAAARERVGQTPEEQLRWVVETFLPANLNIYNDEGVKEIGFGLRALTPPVGTSWRVRLHRAPGRRELAELQRRIRAGLVRLLEQDADQHDQHERVVNPEAGLRLPAVQERLVRVSADDADSPAFEVVSFAPSEQVVILRAIVSLIVRAGGQLRRCGYRNCHEIFVRRRKQMFCSEAHSQAERDARKGRRADARQAKHR